MTNKSILTLILFLFCAFVGAQTLTKDYKFPWKGLKQHDFLYASEWDTRKPKA